MLTLQRPKSSSKVFLQITWSKLIDTFIFERVYFMSTVVVIIRKNNEWRLICCWWNSGSDWGEANARSCEGQKEPFSKTYPAGPHPAQLVVEKVIGAMPTAAVHLLNVTALSQLRKEGHPSVYGLGGHRAMDCSHWCLAGVPDTWNQLLYAALLRS